MMCGHLILESARVLECRHVLAWMSLTCQIAIGRFCAHYFIEHSALAPWLDDGARLQTTMRVHACQNMLTCRTCRTRQSGRTWRIDVHSHRLLGGVVLQEEQLTDDELGHRVDRHGDHHDGGGRE